MSRLLQPTRVQPHPCLPLSATWQPRQLNGSGQKPWHRLDPPSLSTHPMHPINQQIPREARSWLFLAMPQPLLSPGCSLHV